MVPIITYLPLAGLFILTSAGQINKFESTLTKKNVLLPGYDGGIAPWMPAPTHPPDPQFAAIAIKRDVATCGFWLGILASPVSPVVDSSIVATKIRGFPQLVIQLPTPYVPEVGSQARGQFAGSNFNSRNSLCVTALKTVTSDFVRTLTAWYCGNSLWRGAWSMGDTSATTSSPTTSISQPSSSPPITISSVETPTATPTPTPEPPPGLPIGPIVGGVIGGLVVIGLSIFAIVWMHGRNKRNRDNSGHVGTPGQNLPHTPEAIQTPVSSAESSQYVYKPVSNGYRGNYPSTHSPDVAPPDNAYSQHSRAYEHETGELSPMSSQVPAYRNASQDLSVQGVFEVPCTNAAGTGNNATELSSEHRRSE
nr:uncharacterized protein CTRU02_08445 [Colletotrichum truncatum]KAF6789746.1 hypothetical protein CTRU02_08445 [Colletotrichum truncatum]